MILDEADLVMNSFITFSADSNLNGLYHLKTAEKVVYLSATFPSYYTNIVSNCFGGYTSNQFKSQYEICHKVSSPFKIDDLNFQNESQMLQQIRLDLIDIQRMPKKTPLIFFIENWDDELVNAIDKEVKLSYSSPLIRIKTEAELLRVMATLKSQSTGAVIIDAKYGRGLNLRYQGDCEIRVISNGEFLNWSMVLQMVGRSCRRFGLCVGKVYINSRMQTESMNSGGKDLLLSREVNWSKDEGPHIAKQLFNKFAQITRTPMRKEIIAAMGGNTPNWRTRRDDFRANVNVYKFLKEDNYKPTGAW